MRELFWPMSADETQNKADKRKQYLLNLSLAGLVGQVGFVTLAIVLAALFGGLWLDRQLGTRILFTILFIIVAGPLSLFVTFRLALNAVAKIKPAPARSDKEENSSE